MINMQTKELMNMKIREMLIGDLMRSSNLFYHNSNMMSTKMRMMMKIYKWKYSMRFSRGAITL